MSISVKRATLANIKEIAELFNLYRVFYKQDSDLDLAATFLSERISREESVIFYVVNEHGEALGFTQLYPTFSSIAARRSWVLNDLFVTASSRKSGVGRELMSAAKAFAKASGANGIALETTEDNVSAQALYESLGYKKDSGFYHYFLDLEQA